MSSNLFDMTNKVALITGSSKGIGRAIAEEMVRQGAKVVISSRKADVCQEVAEAINAEAKASGNQTGEAIVIPAHVGQREALQYLVDETRVRLGQIDVLVCNARLIRSTAPCRNCLTMPWIRFWTSTLNPITG